MHTNEHKWFKWKACHFATILCFDGRLRCSARQMVTCHSLLVTLLSQLAEKSPMQSHRRKYSKTTHEILHYALLHSE